MCLPLTSKYAVNDQVFCKQNCDWNILVKYILYNGVEWTVFNWNFRATFEAIFNLIVTTIMHTMPVICKHLLRIDECNKKKYFDKNVFPWIETHYWIFRNQSVSRWKSMNIFHFYLLKKLKTIFISKYYLKVLVEITTTKIVDRLLN